MPREASGPRGRKTYRRCPGRNNSPISKKPITFPNEQESSCSENEQEEKAHHSSGNCKSTKSSKEALSSSPVHRKTHSNNKQTSANRSPSPIETFRKERAGSISFTDYKENHSPQSCFLQPSDANRCYKSKSGLYFKMPFVVLIVTILGVLTIQLFNEKKVVAVRRNCHKIEDLKHEHPSQDTYLWRAVKIGIEGVLNGKPPKPSIFLFLHHHETTTRNIVNEIVDVAAKCFDPKLEAMVLNSEDFNSEDVLTDYGTVIHRYQNSLRSGGVVFIADLNKISAKAARALHFICDNENPLINNVIIFLTLEPSSDVGKPVEIAEQTLYSIWSDNIDNNSLSALIARVTDQVIKLYPE